VNEHEAMAIPSRSAGSGRREDRLGRLDSDSDSSAASGTGISSHAKGPARWIEIDRPARRNALTVDDRLALAEHLRAADRAPDVRVIVVTGAGGTFCSGGDVHEFARRRDQAESEAYAETTAQAVFRTVRSMRTPTIARVQGVAAGAGMFLALGCDIVIADESATFHPAHLRLGLVPDWGAVWLLPRLVGVARAKLLLLTGQTLRATKAAEWGLIAECVPQAQLDEQVTEYVDCIASLPPTALALTRQGLDASLDVPLGSFLAWERKALGVTMSSDEHYDRVQAFLAGSGRRARSDGRPAADPPPSAESK
jgi:2-(1,2-epoxy-1,2-dihydrophenyl)acetyl-CoA isomerase